MTYTGSLPPLRAYVVLAAIIAACSGGDLALPGPPAPDADELHLTRVAGNAQTGTVGEPLPDPLVVELRDSQGQPVVGLEVAFVFTSGPATADLMPDTAVTNAAGQATGRWVLGTTPGDYTAEARVVLPPGEAAGSDRLSAEFTASAEPAPPDTLRAESALQQFGRRNREVEEGPTVRVVDRFGNAVADVPVRWQVTEGGGKVSEPVVFSDADGRASVTWKVGDEIGLQELTSTVDGDIYGSPVVFTATVFF